MGASGNSCIKTADFARDCSRERTESQSDRRNLCISGKMSVIRLQLVYLLAMICDGVLYTTVHATDQVSSDGGTADEPADIASSAAEDSPPMDEEQVNTSKANILCK